MERTAFGRRGQSGIPILALTVLLLGTYADRAAAQTAGPADIVGTWAMQVQLRDCGTQSPLGPPLNSIVTFHQGGTTSETAGPSGALATGQRSQGHGIWSHQGGAAFVGKMLAIIAFDSAPNPPVSPGFFAGWQTVTHQVQLAGDRLTSTGTNGFYRFDRSLYRSGCSTAAGDRLK